MGRSVTSEEPDLAQTLSPHSAGRSCSRARTALPESSSATAEEYWPDMEGLDYRDTVTDSGAAARDLLGIFAVVHVLTTATLDAQG